MPDLRTPPPGADPWRHYRPLDFLPELRMIVCNRCEVPILDAARARRIHDEHHNTIDAALSALAS